MRSRPLDLVAGRLREALDGCPVTVTVLPASGSAGLRFAAAAVPVS
jgi:hypothetical protein